MVNVGKYASPMEYMEITTKNSGFSKFGIAKCDPFQRIMTAPTFVGVSQEKI